MKMSIQQAEEWCAERGVALSFTQRDGTPYISLSRDDKWYELEYSPNMDGNRETVLGQAIFDMERWLDQGVAPLQGSWVTNS
jgi:hypothetical protein